MIDKFLALGGYIKDQKLTDEIVNSQPNPLMSGACYQIKQSGRGKRMLLSDFTIKVLGKYNSNLQGTSDCTSFMMSRCIELLNAINVVTLGESWEGFTATEPGYALARVEIGKNRWSGGGASGSAIAQAAKEYGCLLRKKYGDIDLTTYSAKRADDWGSYGKGLPDILEPYSRQHTVKSITLVNTYYELIDSIQNGYPVGICSGVGFMRVKNRNGQCVRDKNGVLYEGGSWPHALTAIGFDDSGPIKKVCIDNSWGLDWVTGPTDGAPESGFWVEASTIDKMLSEGDSFSYSDLMGYPAKKLNLRIL